MASKVTRPERQSSVDVPGRVDLNRRAARSSKLGDHGGKMVSTLKTLAAGALLAVAASAAGAAPANLSQVPDGVSNDVVRVHGDHRDCRRDGWGWHRHNRYGERRECREWRGGGRRPNACVKVGPIWYCDY
jgi:hypothetical protein